MGTDIERRRVAVATRQASKQVEPGILRDGQAQRCGFLGNDTVRLAFERTIRWTRIARSRRGDGIDAIKETINRTADNAAHAITCLNSLRVVAGHCPERAVSTLRAAPIATRRKASTVVPPR